MTGRRVNKGMFDCFRFDLIVCFLRVAFHHPNPFVPHLGGGPWTRLAQGEGVGLSGSSSSSSSSMGKLLALITAASERA